MAQQVRSVDHVGTARALEPGRSDVTEPNTEAQPAAAVGQQALALPFGLLRLAAIVATIAALALVTVMHLSLARGLVPLVVEASVVLGIGVSAEATLRWTFRRLRRERERTERLWLSRQAELEDIACRDDLTQLQNRRFFYERLQEEMVNAANRRKPLSILMIDVDDLKAINDEFGHQVGDVVLRQFARILNRHAQEYVTARLGGDEFAVIMPAVDRRRADGFAWRLWDELAASPVYENGHASIYLGVSIGSGGYPWGGSELEEVIHWADAKLYANKLERKGMKGKTSRQTDIRLVSGVVDVLSTALEVRDKMTHRHSRRVARMAGAVAREMGLSQQDVLEIENAAALHDIGKIGVADSILRKAHPLEPDEWKDMRRHSELGYEILSGVDFLRGAAEIVYAHHERYDGAGYPRGLVGDEIPLGARVFAVVDAFDAMTSRRPYREAVTREVATIEVGRNSGTQFDPRVVGAFLAVIHRGAGDFRSDGDEFGSRVVVGAAEGADATTA